jgi:hypothetical protein
LSWKRLASSSFQNKLHCARHSPHGSGVPTERCRYLRHDTTAYQRRKPLLLSLGPFRWLGRFHA